MIGDFNAISNLPSGTVAVVSPGLLPVPPVSGGSVETVIQKMAEITGTKFKIDIYGRTAPALPAKETKNGITHIRIPAKPDYFRKIRSSIKNRHYSIIQAENRPLFIPQTKAGNPGSKFICSLHSLIHIAENLIKPGLTLQIFHQCDKILVYSQFMRDRLIEMFPRVSDRVCSIHLGTEPDKFRPRWEPYIQKQAGALKRKLRIPEHHKVVLFAGRVIPKKGVHILVTAMEQVLKEYPDCCLVVLGSGWFGNTRPSPYIKTLHKMALKIAKNVRFTNYVHPGDLPLYFALGDVFVCPSQWDEPFGLVNTEAMASGVPVVASARGGIPEVVKHGINGFLVYNEANPRSFVGPVLSLLNDPALNLSLGTAGRDMVEKYFNWDRAGSELIGLYQSLL